MARKAVTFYDRLKDYPWLLFGQFNPLFKIIVMVLALAAWIPDPLDIVTLSFWGIITGVLLQKMVATWIVVGLGIVFWIFAQIVESLVVIVITTYLIPGIVGLVCYVLETDPLPILFKKTK